MKELVKRLSVPIAEMGACMVMVCLLPSCSVASLFHEEIGKEEAMVLMADSTRYVGKTFLPDFQGKSFRLVTDEGKRVKIKSGEVEQLRFRRDGKQSGVFVYVPYVARGGKESKPGWVNCQGVGRGGPDAQWRYPGCEPEVGGWYQKRSGVRGYRVSDGLEPEDARFQVCHGV